MEFNNYNEIKNSRTVLTFEINTKNSPRLTFMIRIRIVKKKKLFSK